MHQSLPFLFVCFVVLGIGPGALHVLAKCSTAELQPPSQVCVFCIHSFIDSLMQEVAIEWL